MRLQLILYASRVIGNSREMPNMMNKLISIQFDQPRVAGLDFDRSFLVKRSYSAWFGHS